MLRHRWALLIGLACILITNWLAIYPAQIVRMALDDVLAAVREAQAGNNEAQTIVAGHVLGYGGLVLLVALIRGIFLYIMRMTIIAVSRKIEFAQKNELFDQYQTYSLSILRRNQTGDLMARISEDVGNVRMFLGPGIMYTLNTAILFVLIFTTMVLVSPTLSLYVLLPMPLLAYLIYYVHSRIVQRTDERQQQLSRVSSFTQEAYSGIRLIRGYARESAWEDWFERESAEYRRLSMRVVLVDAFFFPVVAFLTGLSMLFTIWLGGYRVLDGSISPGNIAEFFLYLNLLVWPVTALGWVTSLTQKAIASQRRINELLRFRSEIDFEGQAQLPNQAVSIAFDHVSFRYPDTGIEALRNISFELAPGQMLGLIGPTGSGKTTLANVLLRFLEPDLGQVTLDGRPVADYSKSGLRQHIGYVAQDGFLFSDTIAQNIAFGAPDATVAQVEAAARFACVHDDIVAFPRGYETLVGERGVTLSGGQKQRVSIARAFVRQPGILLLDDSLSAVDAATEEHILQNLRGMRGQGYKPTLIVISHRIATVQTADLILYMDDGRVVEAGTHGELLALGGSYARLYRKQQLEVALLEH
jgi:ATP-binding cassette subfamily B protein